MRLVAADGRLDRSRIANYANLTLALLLFSYTLVRSIRLSFTHDESLTYLIAVKAPLRDTVLYQLGIPSNNHLLNSLLAKLCSTLSTSPAALRLPNVLAHAGYLFAALRLANRLVPPGARVFAFVVLTLNPFMLDFFSMCRGYGLACSFELLALWLLVQCAEATQIRPWLAASASLLAALCPLANFSFLTFFLAFSATIAMLELAKWARPTTRDSSPATAKVQSLLCALGLQLLIVGLLCAFVVPLGLKLRARGELYYGGSVGFFSDTLGSLLEASTYYKPYPSVVREMLLGLGALLFVGSLWFAAQSAWRGRRTAAWLCALGLLTALLCVVQHHVMGTKFPVDRTALFFVPMFAAALVASSAESHLRGTTSAVLGAATLLLTVNAARSLNLRYFAQWQYDANTARMLEQLARARAGQRVQLGANWLFVPTISYYREERGLRWLSRVGRGSIEDDRDYYYFLPEDEGILARRSLETIQRYKTSGATLARQLR